METGSSEPPCVERGQSLVRQLPPPGRDERAGRVLLLDDDPALVRAIARNLERQGYVVASFTRAAAACTEFARCAVPFDVVLTDYAMPGCNGLDFARRLRALRADLPILLLSGDLRPEVFDEAKRLGIFRLLRKPIGMEELLAALEQARMRAPGAPSR